MKSSPHTPRLHADGSRLPNPSSGHAFTALTALPASLLLALLAIFVALAVGLSVLCFALLRGVGSLFQGGSRMAPALARAAS